MNLLAAILIFLLLLTFFIVFLYYRNSENKSEKSLIFENKKLYSGEDPVFTSNYTDKILYKSKEGLSEYDLETGKTRVLNKEKPKGLAYDKKHLQTMKIIFCAAELRTKFSMVFFVLCQAIQSVRNIMVKKRMSLMLFFFFVVLGIFILSVHLRKVN